ncbi:major facilitator superfamily domain-containing protein [Pseudomassariella vexata]|uniref:Major facilitator superfamily domain-containing protein n=1 Tax=Pseudomassariella vexata TaxID=1141098 RepID=A0A1Y2DI30_9PEZI|nr:major facilitator superfamily domain-containing protein [Pseudomassariella vexata]ORY58889.1 major facilitator superfamily domain-containing protein [Pseudomassariella vexata]
MDIKKEDSKIEKMNAVTHSETVTKNEAVSDYDIIAMDFISKDAEWHAYKTKKLLWKVDLRLLPWLILMYTTNFLDRTALAQARLGTLEQNLGLKGVEYNTLTSILFIGYIVFQLPSNLLLTKVRPSLYLCLMMAIWGMISACQSVTRSFTGKIVCRLFLGAAEAPFFSGAIFLMSSWYRANELTHRISILYAGVALANMFGGLIAAGVLSDLHMAHGIAGWRWLHFFPTIVQSLGYGNTQTLLLTVPVWFATLLAVLGVSYNSSRVRDRAWHILGCMLVGAAGNVLVVTTNGIGPRMFAMYLIPMGVQPAFQIILAWITSSFPRPLAKRAVVVAATGMFGNLSSTYGSYMYPATDGPKYVPAGIGLACVCCFCGGMAVVIRVAEVDQRSKAPIEANSNTVP